MTRGSPCSVLLLFLLASCSRPPLTGPAAHPWASFPAGTWIELRFTLGGREWVERWDLVSKDEHVVRLRLTVDGKSNDQQLAVTEAAWTEKGDDTLRLAGRDFRCRRQERDGEKRWMSGDLPAWPVREVSAEGATELVAVNETVDGRPCMVFETRLADGGKMRRWKSLAVPGHVAREVRQTEAGDARVDLVRVGP